MEIGVQEDYYVYRKGEKRPAQTVAGGIGAGPDFGDRETTGLPAGRDGVPVKGRKYIVELKWVLFETDRRWGYGDWDPQYGKYRVLLKGTFRKEI